MTRNQILKGLKTELLDANEVVTWYLEPNEVASLRQFIHRLRQKHPDCDVAVLSCGGGREYIIDIPVEYLE